MSLQRRQQVSWPSSVTSSVRTHWYIIRYYSTLTHLLTSWCFRSCRRNIKLGADCHEMCWSPEDEPFRFQRPHDLSSSATLRTNLTFPALRMIKSSVFWFCFTCCSCQNFKMWTYLDPPDTGGLWGVVGGVERWGEGAFVCGQCSSTLWTTDSHTDVLDM